MTPEASCRQRMNRGPVSPAPRDDANGRLVTACFLRDADHVCVDDTPQLCRRVPAAGTPVGTVGELHVEPVGPGGARGTHQLHE
jgi:hypothetical protein